MAITHGDISDDENIGRRVLVRARMFAPCLDFLDGEARLNAIAVLEGVVAELPATGSRRTKSMSRNGTSITFEMITAAFSDDDIAMLQSLCDSASTGSAPGGIVGPVGSFPTDRPISRAWPEGRYS